MRAHDRMIFRELLAPLAIGLFLFLVMLVGNTLYAILDQLIREHWPLSFVGRLLILNIPTALNLAIPVACALAPGLAWSRLTRDNETIALRAAGVSLLRQTIPVMVLGALCGLTSSVLTEKVVPKTWSAQSNVENWLAALPTTTIDKSLTFQVSPITLSWWKTRKYGRTSFEMEDVTVLDRGSDGSSARITVAPKAQYRDSTWVLYNAQVHAIDRNGITLWDAQAKRQLLALSADFQSGAMMPSSEQLQNKSREEIADLLKVATDPNRTRELQAARDSKLVIPLICVGLALCAVPLAIWTRHYGPIATVVTGLCTVALAQFLIFAVQIAAVNAYLPTVLIAPLPGILALMVGLIAIRSAE